MSSIPAQPEGDTGALVPADGSIFWGRSNGASGTTLGEVCFNTSMTGDQEILTDPSYPGQGLIYTLRRAGRPWAGISRINRVEQFNWGNVITEYRI